jgi:hypothetical protein
MAMTEDTVEPTNVVQSQPNNIEDEVNDLRKSISDWLPPSNKQWLEMMNPMLPMTRLACIVIRKSRTEMSEVVRRMLADDPDTLAHMMDQLAWTGDYFAQLATLCAVAEARHVAHGAPPPNVDRRSPTHLA